MVRIPLTSVAALFLFAATAEARLLIPRVRGEVRADGELSEPLWQESLLIDRFYEVEPGDNVEPPVKTTARVAYDERYLYVGFECEDPQPQRIRGPFVARDRVLADQDFVQIDIDAQDDGKSSTIFRINPRGIQTDGTYTEAAGRDDFAPDFQFEAGARIGPGGWSAEMRIPLTSLRYGRNDPQTWRMTFLRIYPRQHRYQIMSAPVERGSTCYLCTSLRLEGITGLPAAGGITVTPYTTGRASGGEGLETATSQDAGADVKWQPGPSMSVDATINPDFSQVESDAPQLAVNDRFAIFYPEKRPFFMEGTDLLNSPLQAIHTRTITSPRWGTRLTARPGNSAFTLVLADDRGGGSVIVPGPAYSTLAPQPHDSLALIGRYRYSRGRSSGGFLLTSRDSGEVSSSNQVAGPDLLWWFREDQSLTAQLLFSRSAEGSESFDGRASFLAWDRTSPRVAWNVTLTEISDQFRADSGFIPQAGIRSEAARLSYTAYPSRYLTRLQSDLVFENVDEIGGGTVSRTLYPRVTATGWRSTVAQLELRPDEKGRALDGTELAQSYAFAMLRFLPSRRFPYLRLTVRYGEEIDIEHSRVGTGTELTVFSSLQPLDHLQTDLEGEAHRLRTDDGPVFDAAALRARITWTFSTRSFVRLIGELRRVDWNLALAPGHRNLEGSTNATLLYGYRLNWQTMLYAGYGDERLIDEQGSATSPRRDLFLKLSYAVQR